MILKEIKVNEGHESILELYYDGAVNYLEASKYLTKEEIKILKEDNNIEDFFIDKNGNICFSCGVTISQDALKNRIDIKPNLRLNEMKKMWGDCVNIKLYNKKSMDKLREKISSKKVSVFINRKKYIRLSVSCRGEFARVYAIRLEDKEEIENIINKIKLEDKSMVMSPKDALKEKINAERPWIAFMVSPLAIIYCIICRSIIGNFLSNIFICYFIMSIYFQLMPALPKLDVIENIEDFLEYSRIN